MKLMSFVVTCVFCFVLLFDGGANEVFAVESELRALPDEYESIAGHGAGFGNGGVAAEQGGLSSVRVNPALIAVNPEYSVGGGYHWPTEGREYYDIGVVDSMTSSVAAGVLYSTSGEDHEFEFENPMQSFRDSPVMRRVNGAVAQRVQGKVSLGASIQFVEARHFPGTEERVAGKDRVKGFGFGLGAFGRLTDAILWGVSAENISNEKMRDYMPKTYRAGAAAKLAGGDVSLHLDYKNRERVAYFEGKKTSLFGENDPNNKVETEQLGVFSFSLRVYDAIRLLGNYGQEIGGERSLGGGGIALVGSKAVLSYIVNKPHMKFAKNHQSINLGINVSM